MNFERLVDDLRVAYQQEFGVTKDFVQLLGQDNLHRYLPVQNILIRVTAKDDAPKALIAIAAAQVMQVPDITVSFAPDANREVMDLLLNHPHSLGPVTWSTEPEEQVVQWITDGQIKRVRYLHVEHVEPQIRRACHEHWVGLIDRPVVSDGRVELVWYCEEQSISRDYHRYGNLGRRSGELRRPLNGFARIQNS